MKCEISFSIYIITYLIEQIIDIEFALIVLKRRETREIYSGKSLDILNKIIKTCSLPIDEPQNDNLDPLLNLSKKVSTLCIINKHDLQIMLDAS